MEEINTAYDKIVKDVDYAIIEGAPSIRKFVRVGLVDVSIAKALSINELIYFSIGSISKGFRNHK